MRTPTLACLVALSALSSAWLNGCGDSSGEGDGDAGSGNLGGAESGGASGAGGSATGGNGPGTGGNEPGGPAVSGASLYDCAEPTGEMPALGLQLISEGFGALTLVTHAPGDADRLFAVEKDGVISVLEKGNDGTYTKAETSFLNVTAKMVNNGEQGLLGLAFHPDYAENGLFYVHYSAGGTVLSEDVDSGDSYIEEYEVSADPNIADAASGRLVIYSDHPDNTDNHDGGTITFGADDYLYIFLGDGAADNTSAQSVTGELLGNVLRIDPLGADDGDYSSPADNLKQTVPAAEPEIWDIGLRNPYRANFDGCTGDLYIGDVGDVTWEEIDVTPAGAGAQNYGWPIMEGLVCHGGGDDCDKTGLTLPMTVVPRNDASAIIGGSVYRGADIPALRGTYVFATLNATVRSFIFDGTTISEPLNITDDVNPIGDDHQGSFYSVQNGGDGEIYFTTGSGKILKLVAE